MGDQAGGTNWRGTTRCEVSGGCFGNESRAGEAEIWIGHGDVAMDGEGVMGEKA